jgi:hypothetical protein
LCYKCELEIAVRRGNRIWIIAALVVALLIPIPYLASPVWQVAVVDEAGVVEGMTVRRVYQNYSTEAEGHEDDQTTDRQGRATFAAKWSSASIARRCVFTAFSALAGVHASFGRHAYVFAFGNGREGYAVSGGVHSRLERQASTDGFTDHFRTARRLTTVSMSLRPF